MEFEWDVIKERINVQIHSVAFGEAVECFYDPYGLKLTDKTHSKNEERFYWVGKSKSGRILTTRFTLRKDVIRIIGSAEWRKFRKMYHEAAKNDGP